MKTIAIKVSPNLADAYEKADIEYKRKAEQYINAWLTHFFNNQKANDTLFDIMKKATIEAEKNGFTESKLQELLDSDG